MPAAFLALFFAWPVAAIIARGLSVDGLLDLLRTASIRRIAWFTVWQATLSTALTVAVSIPAAYAFARFDFPGRRVVLAAVQVPFVLPTVVVGAAFLALLPRSWHGSVPAILLAHVFFNYPVGVRTVGAVLARTDPALVDAARTLGASPWKAFRSVTLPLLRPAIAAAASIVFLFCFTAFGTVLLLGGGSRVTLEVEIYRRTAQLLDLRGAAALALAQLVALGLLLAWYARGQRRRAVAQRQRTTFRRRPQTWRDRTLLGANLLVAAALIGLPLARLVERSFALGDGTHGLAWYRTLGAAARTTADVVPIDAVLTSLRYALLAGLVAAVVGSCAALAIAAGGRAAVALDTGLMLPLATSAVTVGFGLLITVDRLPIDLRSSGAIIVIAQSIVATPFVVRAVLPVLRTVEPHVRDAAATLGASPWRLLVAVDLPIARRALAAGVGFAAAVSLGEFGASVFLARPDAPTLPVAVYRLLGRPGAANTGRAYALATLLMLVTTAVVLGVDRSGGDRVGDDRAW